MLINSLTPLLKVGTKLHHTKNFLANYEWLIPLRCLLNTGPDHSA